nr:MAG TPA: Pyocin activator protein PrtN [Caudoviricetes sp.]
MSRYLISIPKAAKEFGIGRDRLYALCNSDPTVPIIKVGEYTKINKPLFAEWLDKATKEGRSI